VEEASGEIGGGEGDRMFGLARLQLRACKEEIPLAGSEEEAFLHFGAVPPSKPNMVGGEILYSILGGIAGKVVWARILRFNLACFHNAPNLGRNPFARKLFLIYFLPLLGGHEKARRLRAGLCVAWQSS
jgi:hypothetical protein